jgi:hypothetical protein
MGYTTLVDESRAPLWTMVGLIVAFKVWGAILILLNDQSRSAIEMILVMNWPFLLPVALLFGPAVWWMRLLRGRAKRRRLIRAEWHVEQPGAAEKPGKV